MVGDVVQARTEDGMRPAVYFPYTQIPALLQVLAATRRDGASVTRDVGRALVAAGLTFPVTYQTSLDDRVTKSRAVPRFQLMLIGAFAVVAVLLAALGLYGTLAFTVRSRLREIGIRMAMGARPFDILRLMLRQGVTLVAMGVLAGLALTLALARILRRVLLMASATDPFAFIGVTLLLAAVALAACYIPARRAMRVDPTNALRHE